MATASVVRVKSWLELQRELFEDSYSPGLRMWRSPYAYRGLADVRFTLKNSLTRMGRQYRTLEPSLVRSFRKYAPQALQEQGSEWQWLSLAQHHGLPTRLLDWTWSPQVAAHFATSETDHYDADGAIWGVNVVAVRDALPQEMLKILKGTAYVFDVNMLSKAARDLKQFDAKWKRKFVAFFEPPSIDSRIVNQYALFSVMNDPNLELDQWLESRPDFYRKIVIPAALKWEVRDKLDQMNLNERVLFPGLDGLSAWLKRNYMARD